MQRARDLREHVREAVTTLDVRQLVEQHDPQPLGRPLVSVCRHQHGRAQDAPRHRHGRTVAAQEDDPRQTLRARRRASGPAASHGASVTRSVRRDIQRTATIPATSRARIKQRASSARRPGESWTRTLPGLLAACRWRASLERAVAGPAACDEPGSAGALDSAERSAGSCRTGNWPLRLVLGSRRLDGSWKLEAGAAGSRLNRHDRHLPSRQRDRQHRQHEHAGQRERPDHVPQRRRRGGAGETRRAPAAANSSVALTTTSATRSHEVAEVDGQEVEGCS